MAETLLARLTRWLGKTPAGDRRDQGRRRLETRVSRGAESRARAFAGMGRGLPSEDPRVARLLDAAAKHADYGLSYVFSGHDEGEHWLGTFANYALSEVETSRHSSLAH
jgi:hypothetical protein